MSEEEQLENDAQMCLLAIKSGAFEVWINEEADPVELMYTCKN